MISLLIIPAAAIGITLLYASILDIRERRVPFPTWYPVFLIIIPTSAAFYGLFLLHLTPVTFLPFLFCIGVVTILLMAADYGYTLFAHAEKPDRKEVFRAGIVWLIFAIPLSTVLFGLSAGRIVPIGLLALFFCVIVYIFGTYFFGGADYIALLVIGVGIPVFPLEPLTGYPLIGYFPWSAFLNALVLNIFAPVGIFFFNRYHGHQAPLRYQFLGYPVRGEEIQTAYGFVMENISEEEGVIHRRFLSFREMLRSLVSGTPRIYTKDLRSSPEKYERELALYRKAGTVWISYGVPFIVPITAGFLSAIFIGDLIFIVLKLVAGY